MRAWHFSENAYPYLPPEDDYESIRVSLPNRLYDPKKGAVLYDRYIDEWLIAEDEGVEIMLNEHHQTATCVDPAAPLVLAALARLTKKARLLILGNPVANRRQPVRVAEEMAMLDAVARYHGFSKSATLTSLVKREFWRLFPRGNGAVRPDPGARVVGEKEGS